MKIRRDELMVLLNNLYEEDADFEIKTKLTIDKGDTPLAWIDLKDNYAEIKTMSGSEFNELTFEREEVLPDYSNYITSLVSAGVLKLEEWEKQYAKIAREFKKSIYERQRPLYVSFDTNCFINRISYQLEKYVGSSGAFVVAEGVRRELFTESARRYTEFELRTLIHKDRRFEELINQPKVKERLKKIGRAEYDRFRAKMRFEEIPSGTGDNEIAEVLGNFAKTRNCDVWLITFDKNMYEISAGFGIKPILFEFPKPDRKAKARWEEVRDLLYTMAVIFGFINVSGIHIFGIWRGKNPDDWNKERVLITDGDKKILEKIEKDLAILKALNEIAARV